MRGAVLYGPRDVRLEEREVPKIIKPTDAVIRISSACVCGPLTEALLNISMGFSSGNWPLMYARHARSDNHKRWREDAMPLAQNSSLHLSIAALSSPIGFLRLAFQNLCLSNWRMQ